MFALAREHADRTGREAVMFSSILRAQVSLAWVIGPPLAYALALWGLTFTVMYLSAAVAFVVCGVMVWLFLPSMSKNVPLATGAVEAPRRNRRDTLLLFVICTLMWGTNSLYIINMPLFIINELHLPEKLAGIMMGTAAGLEIPTMLIAGYFAKRLGKRLLMRIAVVAGFFFYARHAVYSPAILLAYSCWRFTSASSAGLACSISGSDAGTSGFSHNSLYKYHSRGLDYLPDRWRVLPLKSGTITRYSGLR